MPLASACIRAGLNREKLLRRVQQGEVKARQEPNGRWMVDVASLDAYLERAS